MKKTDKEMLEREIVQFFGVEGYKLLPDTAPQGSNTFCCNRILLKNGEKFLLKSIFLNKLKADTLAQVRVEADICKKVRSSNVVSLVDSKESADFIFLLFPFLKGESLEEYMSKVHAVDASEIQRIGIGILRGITDISRDHGVIHQDIKPANIFVCEDGRIVLLDFGTARYRYASLNGSAKGNFEFSSPEQIEGKFPSNVLNSRVTPSDKSDVYSAGLVLYKLAEGKHPFCGYGDIRMAILKGDSPNEMANADITNDLKGVIMKMFQYRPYLRPTAQQALSNFEAGKILPLPIEKSKFYYALSSGENTNNLIRFVDKKEDLFDGIVLGASCLTKDKKKLGMIKFKGRDIIVDPETYLFRQEVDDHSTGFKKLPYYKYYDLVTGGGFFNKIQNEDAEVLSLAKEVFSFQGHLSDSIIPPYFYIEEFNTEYWEADKAITQLSVKIHKEEGSSKNLIKGVALSGEALSTEKTREKLLQYLTSLYDFSGYYVILEDSLGKEIISDQNWLKGARDLFKGLLATGKPVIWGRADLIALGFSTFGLSVATGELQKQKKMSFAKVGGGGRKGVTKPKFLYSPELFSRLKWPDAVQNLESIHPIRCGEQCCSGIDFEKMTYREKSDLAFHYLFNLHQQWRAYTKKGVEAFIEDVKKAEGLFEKIKKSNNPMAKNILRKDIKPDSQAFLESWKELFCID